MLRAPRLAGAATALAALAGAAMVAASASAGWPANDRSGSDFAERHAEMVFDLLPPDAVLFGYGDAAIGPLGYYRYVEGRRPDVALYSLQGLVFANRLYDPRLPEEERARAIDRFVGATGRPVFLSPDADVRPSGRGVGHHGFLLEVLGEGTAGTVDLLRHPPGERYFLELLDRRPADGWEQTRRNGLLSHYGRYLGLVVLSGSPMLLEPLAPLFERAQDCYTCLLGMAIALLDNDAAPHANRIAAWLTRARALHGQAISKSESAQLPFEQGRLAESTSGLTVSRHASTASTNGCGTSRSLSARSTRDSSPSSASSCRRRRRAGKDGDGNVRKRAGVVVLAVSPRAAAARQKPTVARIAAPPGCGSTLTDRAAGAVASTVISSTPTASPAAPAPPAQAQRVPSGSRQSLSSMRYQTSRLPTTASVSPVIMRGKDRCRGGAASCSIPSSNAAVLACSSTSAPDSTAGKPVFCRPCDAPAPAVTPARTQLIRCKPPVFCRPCDAPAPGCCAEAGVASATASPRMGTSRRIVEVGVRIDGIRSGDWGWRRVRALTEITLQCPRRSPAGIMATPC